MRYVLAVALLLGSVSSACAQTSHVSAPLVRASLHEAQLAADAGQWSGAQRTLRALDQQLSLDDSAAAHRVRIRVEFILWDLRLGLVPRARADLATLTGTLDALLSGSGPASS